MKLDKKVEIVNNRNFNTNGTGFFIILLLVALAFYAIHSWVVVRKFQATSNYAVESGYQFK